MTVCAGVGRRDITPSIGSPAGLGLVEPVTEIWDPLSATALVLESAGERVALVGLDLTGLLAATHASVRDAVTAATGIPGDRIVLDVSHTHSAPYVSAELQGLLRPFGLQLTDDDYEASLADGVAAAVADGLNGARPVARMLVGRAPVERVAGNRRPVGPDGRVVHRYGRPPQWMRELPEGLIDPDVAVIQLQAAAGAPMVTLFSYACHPTAAGGDNHAHVSADLVGAARAAVEAATGAPSLFLQGCSGNTGTGRWVTDDPRADTADMGARLAAGVLEVLGTADAVPLTALRVASRTVALELDPFPPLADLEGRLADAARVRDVGVAVAVGDALVVARRADELRRARITAVLLDEVALVVLPGEAFLQHGLAVRAGSPFATTIVAAYDDNTLQYLPAREDFPHGEYEVDGGWRYIRPGEGERLADAAVDLLRSLAT